MGLGAVSGGGGAPALLAQFARRLQDVPVLDTAHNLYNHNHLFRSECSSWTRFVRGSVCMSVCVCVCMYVCNILTPLPFPPLPIDYIFAPMDDDRPCFSRPYNDSLVGNYKAK